MQVCTSPNPISLMRASPNQMLHHRLLFWRCPVQIRLWIPVWQVPWFALGSPGFFFLIAQLPVVGLGLLVIVALRSHRHTTLGRIPVDKWSAYRRDLYLTTHNAHNRRTYIPPAGFEPAISASKRLQTHALDRAVTGIVSSGEYHYSISKLFTKAYFHHLYFWHNSLTPSPGAVCYIAVSPCTVCYVPSLFATSNV
jgi:hypothetical protein